MWILWVGAAAAVSWFLLRDDSSPKIGPQGTYVDKRGVIWSLFTEYSASAISPDGNGPIIWSAEQPKGEPQYCYKTGLCPGPQGSTRASVLQQVDEIVAAFIADPNR